MTPFIGREDELRLLMNRWERVREGEGQVVTIIGEAGIGKSRLVQRFQEEIAANPNTWLECATAPFFQNTPFYAIADMLLQSFHWNANQGTDERLTALAASLGLAGVNPNEAVPLIAPLLELPVDAKYPLLSIPPDQQRKRLLAALVAWTFGAARAQPLVIATEDLHWADPSTLELIQLLVEQGATAPLMLLYTARPEFHGQWPRRAHHTQINLNRLTSGNVRAMVVDFAAKIALSDETIATVIERTGGVPLFVEELTRTVLESGDVKLSGREIPVTLHDSLMARLDRLGPAKEVAQVGAVIGSEFSYELLHAVHPTAEDELQDALRKLVDAELLYVRGIAPDATYQFKHALIRDAAYEALLKSRRKALHRTIASSIDQKFSTLKEAHPEVLAQHWTEAGETELAIVEWSRTGQAAEKRNAFREAQESYKHAASLITLLPESPERDSRELALRQSVVLMLNLTKGLAAAETIEAIEHTVVLAEKSGDLKGLVDLMIRRGFATYFSGDLPTASAIADQALDLAIRDGHSAGLAYAHFLQLTTRYQRADFLGAEEHFTTGYRYFADPDFRGNPGASAVSAFAVGSWTAWIIGRSDTARMRLAEMTTTANENNPFHVALTKCYAAGLRVYLREYDRAERLAARAVELCEEHQYPQFLANSRCMLGEARAKLGNVSNGIELIRQGLEDAGKAGIRVGPSRWITHLAEALERAGAFSDALETIDQALHSNPDEHLYRPETLRIRAELLLKLGHIELAEAGFRESIALAGQMSAKAWKLRSTLSLSRLFGSQGRREEARAMLGEIYGWFTEGFDTADLKDAKALLGELRG
jgi:tetratricopeptide (TPR) repeat protein